MANKKANGLHFTAKYRQSREGGYHYLAVPAAIKQQFAVKGTARVVATIGNLPPFQCGLMPMKSGEGLLLINKARQKLLGLQQGALIEVSLKMDESEYGAPMPEELEAVLAQDEEAKARFDSLTPGRKRAILFEVDRLKGVDRRMERAIKLLLDPQMGQGRW